MAGVLLQHVLSVVTVCVPVAWSLVASLGARRPCAVCPTSKFKETGFAHVRDSCRCSSRVPGRRKYRAARRNRLTGKSPPPPPPSVPVVPCAKMVHFHAAPLQVLKVCVTRLASAGCAQLLQLPPPWVVEAAFTAAAMCFRALSAFTHPPTSWTSMFASLLSDCARYIAVTAPHVASMTPPSNAKDMHVGMSCVVCCESSCCLYSGGLGVVQFFFCVGGLTIHIGCCPACSLQHATALR
mgnify:CR=1 FL=1